MPPGRKLELTGLTPNVERVFQLTRMDTVLTIRPPQMDGHDRVARTADK